MWNWYAWLWEFGFLQRCCFRFNLREAWRCVTGWEVHDASKDPVAFSLDWLTLKMKVLWAFQNIGQHSPSSAASRLRSLESSDEQLPCENQSILVCDRVLCVLIVKHRAIGVFCCRGDRRVLLYVLLYVACRGIFPVVTYEAVVLNFRSGNLAQVYKKLYSMSLRENREETTASVVIRLLDILSGAQSVLSAQQEVTRWWWRFIKSEIL
jgi:hypothetical protein